MTCNLRLPMDLKDDPCAGKTNNTCNAEQGPWHSTMSVKMFEAREKHARQHAVDIHLVRTHNAHTPHTHTGHLAHVQAGGRERKQHTIHTHAPPARESTLSFPDLPQESPCLTVKGFAGFSRSLVRYSARIPELSSSAVSDILRNYLACESYK